MSELKKYELDYHAAHLYMEDTVDTVNTLSKCILERVDFTRGRFYTIFPDKPEFKDHVLSFKVGFRESCGGVTKYVHKFIYEMILKNPKLIGIFDDFLSKYHSDYREPLFLSNGKFLNNEIYYLFSKENVSLETIETAFRYSNQIWHSLTIISNMNEKFEQQKLTIQDCKNLSQNAEMIIVTAYDGQGYLFWEKRD